MPFFIIQNKIISGNILISSGGKNIKNKNETEIIKIKM